MTRAQIRTNLQAEPKIDTYMYFEGSRNSGGAWSQVAIEGYDFDQSIDFPVSSLKVTITDPTNIADYQDDTSATNVVRKGDLVRLSVGTGTGADAIYKFRGLIYRKRVELVKPEGEGAPFARLMLECYDPLVKFTEGYPLDLDKTGTLGANMTLSADNTEYYAQMGTTRPEFPGEGVVQIESEYIWYSKLVAPGHGYAGVDNTHWLLDCSTAGDGKGSGRGFWGSTKATHAITTVVTLVQPRGFPVWTQESATTTISAATITQTTTFIVGPPSQITIAGGSFLTNGFEVGMSVRPTGSVSNDAKTFVIGAIPDATTLTLSTSGDTPVGEVATAGVVLNEYTLFDGTIYKDNSKGSLENYEDCFFPQFNNTSAYDLNDYAVDISADITASSYLIPAGATDPRTLGYRPQGWAVLDDGASQEAFFYYKVREISSVWYFYATQENDPQQTLTAATIAFVDGGGGNDSITDSGSGINTTNVVAGDLVVVTGSSSNDGSYPILVVAAGSLQVATGSLTAEGAGATVTLKIWRLSRGAFGTTATAFATATPTSVKQLVFRQMASSSYPLVMIELTQWGEDYRIVGTDGNMHDDPPALSFPYTVRPRSGFLQFAVPVEDAGNNDLRVAVKVDVYTTGGNDVIYDAGATDYGILERMLEGPIARGGAGFVDGDLDFTAASVDIGYFRADQLQGEGARQFEGLQNAISPKNVFYYFDHINNKIKAALFTQKDTQDYDLDSSYRITDADLETTLEDMASGVRVFWRGYDSKNAATTAYTPYSQWDSASTGWYQRPDASGPPPSGTWGPNNTIDGKQGDKREGFDLRYYGAGKATGQPDSTKFPIYPIYWGLKEMMSVDTIILQIDQTQFATFGNLVDPAEMPPSLSLQGTTTFDPNASGTGATAYGGGWFDISPKATRFQTKVAKTEWTYYFQLNAEDFVRPEMNGLRIVLWGTQQFDREVHPYVCKFRIFSIHVSGTSWQYVDLMASDNATTTDGDPFLPIPTAAYNMWANWRNKFYVVRSDSAYSEEEARHEAFLWLNEKLRDFSVLNIALEWDPTLQVGETYNVTIPQFAMTDRKFFCQRVTESAGKVRASLIDYSSAYWGV